MRAPSYRHKPKELLGCWDVRRGTPRLQGGNLCSAAPATHGWWETTKSYNNKKTGSLRSLLKLHGKGSKEGTAAPVSGLGIVLYPETLGRPTPFPRTPEKFSKPFDQTP